MGRRAFVVSTTCAVEIVPDTLKNHCSHHVLSSFGSTKMHSCGLIFLAYGIIHILQGVGVLPPNFLPYTDAIYGAAGAALFSFYLAYHTRLIAGGKNTKYQMNDKDYVFGASKLLFQ